MSQINISDYPISCITQNKVILGYGYKRNKTNGCLWNGIIRISMKFVDNAMWILNTIAYIKFCRFHYSWSDNENLFYIYHLNENN